MATRYKVKGATDGTAAATWGSALVSADTGIIATGRDKIETNKDLSVGGTVDLAALIFDAGYGDDTLDVADGGTLTVLADNTNTGILKFAGRCGILRLNSSSTAAEIYNLFWYPINPNARLELSRCTVNKLYLQRASSVIAEDVIISSTLYVDGGQHTLKAHTAANAPAIVVNGGQLTIERDFASLVVNGGVVYINAAIGVTIGTITINGGHVVYLVGDACGAIEIYAGELDRSGLQRDAVAANLTAWGAGTIRTEKGVARMTFSAGPTYHGKGPTIIT